MASDPELLRALRAAVQADPENVALRTHLADLLIGAQEFADALRHLEVVLHAHPDHVEALGLAAQAGTTLRDPRADGWARLHRTLMSSEEEESRSSEFTNRGQAPADEASAEEHDWDGFLDEVVRQSGTLRRVTLEDVGGLEDVKRRLEQSFLTPLRNPEMRRVYGTSLRGGLLLWGPPGCGKTFLARAVAGELDASFVNVGLNEILDMWLGNSEKHLHEIFEMARRNTPCVLFFDELDAIGHSRMNLGRSAARNVVVQLLVELDGFDASNDGIFVIGATNQPWDVDPGLRRPGRFDRTMLVLPPDEPARMAILESNLANRPRADADLASVARSAEGLSGADLRLVCDDAAESALAEAVRAGTTQPIETRHLLEALKSVKPSTAPWFESARNHVRYANQEGLYDELASYLKRYRAK